MEARGESAPGLAPAGLRPELRIPDEEPRLLLSPDRRHPCKVIISLRDPAWLRCSHNQIPCHVPRAKRPSLMGNVNDDPRKQAFTWAGCSGYLFGFWFLFCSFFFSDCFCYEFFEGSRQRWCGLNQTKTEMKEKDKKEHWVTIILLSLQIHTSKSTII